MGTNFIETPEISGMGSFVPCRPRPNLLPPRFHSKVETPRPPIKQREESRGRDHMDARHGGGGPGNGFESRSGGRGFPLTGSTADARTRNFCGSWTSTYRRQARIQEIHVAGDYAFCWNQLSLTATPLQGGPAQRRAGPTLSVFRKERDGRWILFRDANMLKTV